MDDLITALKIIGGVLIGFGVMDYISVLWGRIIGPYEQTLEQEIEQKRKEDKEHGA